MHLHILKNVKHEYMVSINGIVTTTVITFQYANNVYRECWMKT